MTAFAGITLKPCPFCGRHPDTLARPDNIDGTQFYAAVMCYCGGYSATAHHGARRKTQDEAMAAASDAWNTRAQEQQADRQRVPDGWKLVPVEPGEWVFADKVLGHDSHPNHKERMRRLYRAMLAAAPEAPAQASAVAEPTSYSHLAEQVSRLMTIGGATITERQQDVLAAALKALGVSMPSRYPIEPERTTPDMRTDAQKLADLGGNPPLASYEHKKPDDTEGGAL